MRLLNTTTKQLESFHDRHVPRYAILSHMWGREEDEVLFGHIVGSEDARHEGEKRKGFTKILGACKQAVEDGWEYIWIDTCCINKESSAELSEAINSMYEWYQKAEVCYVYLQDVLNSGNDHKSFAGDIKMDEDEEDRTFETVPFERSRWFSRGWTLQELIASQYMVFYSRDWIDVGTKASLRDIISVTTRIRVEMLVAYDPKKTSVAERMSWAACRKTTRKEDMAYCLMGLFGVNMPLLYGEGNRAFRRLQEEIMKVSDDHSIFAWKGRYSSYTIPGYVDLLTTKNHRTRGLLADSPWDFRDGVDVVPSDDGAFSPYSMTNQGLQIQLPLQPIDPKQDLLDIDSDYTKDLVKATLKCTTRDRQPTRWIVIYLKMTRKGNYERAFPHLLSETENDPNESELTSLLVPQVDTSTTYSMSAFQKIRMKTLPTESGFTTEGRSLLEGYEDPDDTYLSMSGGPAVTVFDGLEGKRFAVVIGFKDRIWLDVIDIVEEWGHHDRLKKNIRQAYQKEGHRYNMVLRRLDRLSVRISDWSVVVSAKKFNNKNRFHFAHLRITVDIQRELPILARGWLTPFPLIPTSSNFVGDLSSYLDGNYVVHSDFKKECGDWIAVFNPRVERSLEVSLVRSITCCPPSGHSGTIDSPVSCVQFSPDGRYLAMGCTNTVRVYDTNTGTDKCIISDEEDAIYTCVCFSPDGKLLATGAISGRLKFWDIEKVYIRKDYHYGANCFCFSSDNRLIVSGSPYGTIQIWDVVAETSHIFSIDGPKSLVRSVAISHNGGLVAGGWNNITWIWDVATKQLVNKIEGYDNVVFTPDGKGLVIGGKCGLGYLDFGELVHPAQVMGEIEDSNDVGPADGPRASGIAVQGETSQQIISKFPVTSITVSHDGHWVISGLYNGCVQFWNLKNATAQFMLQGHMDPVYSVDMNPVDNIFATGSLDGRVRIWRYDTI